MESRLVTLEENMEKMNQTMQEVLSHVSHPVQVQGPDNNIPAEQPDPGIYSCRDSNESRIAIETSPWQPTNDIPQLPIFETEPALESIAPQFTRSRSKPIENGLPPEDILQELITIFFEMVHPTIPLFHKTTFLEKIYQPGRLVLLYAVVAVSFRFWKRPVPSNEEIESYVTTCREKLLLNTIDACSLVSTQALTLMALDCLGHGTGPKTWNTMSMLVCAAKHLNLHERDISHLPRGNTSTALVRNEDSDDDIHLSDIEGEERRRLAWVIFSLDRFSSVSHGQPGGIETKKICIAYPNGKDEWRYSSTPEWFLYSPPVKLSHVHCANRLWHYNIDLLAVMDRSNQILIRPFNLSIPAHCQEWKNHFRQLNLTLSTWLQNLPQEDQEPPSVFDPMWVMLHATFHLIRIRLFTVAAFPSTTSPYLKPSAAARESCRRTIGEIASLTASLKPHELDQLGPMFAFVVWVASRSMLILWTTGYEKSSGSVPADLDILLSALRRLGLYWPCAQRYTNIIQLVLDAKNNAGGPLVLEIFNDTRRTAHGLQDRLGSISSHLFSEIYPQPWNLLGNSSLYNDDLGGALYLGDMWTDTCDEWLV